MTRAIRALRAFETKICLLDGSPRWPHLDIRELEATIADDHWYVPRVLTSRKDLEISFLCDNRIVALDGTGSDGRFLMLLHLALSAHMVNVPGATRFSHPYTDGGFRFGYRFKHETKKEQEEIQFAIMVEALTAMADAANAFSQWVENVRLAPVFRMYLNYEPNELRSVQDIQKPKG